MFSIMFGMENRHGKNHQLLRGKRLVATLRKELDLLNLAIERSDKVAQQASISAMQAALAGWLAELLNIRR